MDFLWVLSWLGIVLLTGFLLLAVWAVYYHISQTEIPPGISQPLQLRFLHCLLIMAFALAHILKKLHICTDYKLLRFFMDGIPPLKDPQLSIKNLSFDGIPVRMYQPRGSCDGGWRGIIYFHGGIGLYGSIDAYERMCRAIAKESNSLLVSVGYRLAPEHPYPAQFEDCLTAATYFMKNVRKYGVNPALIIVSGDSSGGTIAASVCQHLVTKPDLPKVRAQILIYPYLQAVDFNLPSYQRNSHVPIFYQEQVVEFGIQYLQKDMSLVKEILGGFHIPQEIKLKYRKWLGSENLPKEFQLERYRLPQPSSDSTRGYEEIKMIFETILSPLLAEDAVVQQLPETYILTCEYDVFLDDGIMYKKRLEDNGVPVTWYQLQDGFHGVLIFLNNFIFSFSGSQKGLNSIVNFIKSL
ncbi:arylacetamide deacetylase-like 4 [Heteronotia binoei]|uniref:arylacetamide deacetylase-like 4 n=1 Tax=Heteronotia binoei TaxID=13085 RepID=UPI00292D29BA|nr:arylacetamide deacetylase-like 4 [Heteronotia binoei]